MELNKIINPRFLHDGTDYFFLISLNFSLQIFAIKKININMIIHACYINIGERQR
jgi:hypothetical protein